MLQFTKLANCYFLMIVILELFVGGVGEAVISALPLCLVVSVSMIKDIIEDRSRYKADQEENDRETEYTALSGISFTKTQSRDIKVGCFVKV